MDIFIESIKRMYVNGKIDMEKVADLLIKNRITKEEYDYIIGNGGNTNV